MGITSPSYSNSSSRTTKRKGKTCMVSLSLHLVQLFDRIVQLDSSFKPGRDSQLKNRLAEAVHDDSTRIELRLLNSEHPELSYFDARDCVMKLMSQYGKSNKLRQNTVVQQAAADQDVRSEHSKAAEPTDSSKAEAD